MSFTYNPTDDTGKVRLLITDRDSSNQTFSDEEIAVFLELGGSVFRGAAQALETIAANEVLVQKRIKTLSLQTDGPACAEALRKLAESLRARDDESDAGFDVVEMVNNDFGARERLFKQALRGSF
jgi:hypothetical protein